MDDTANRFRLDNCHVLITGAGGGIGRALVDAFTAAGASITAADRDPHLLDALDAPHKLVFDIADSDATGRAISRLLEETGTPDVLVNNAGFARGETLASVDREIWEREIAGNLTGAFNVTAPIVRAMAARGGGAVVFVSSVNALAYYGNPAYSAAKAGMVAYAKAIVVEHGADGIRANIVCPGSVHTPAWSSRLERRPGLLDEVVRHYPLGRLVTPAEVANAALFLASPAASGVTGAVLTVDAGLMAGNLRFFRDVIAGD